ncbi:MAG: HD domain-containing protein, partial [Lachnospiraceae bacterium]|nr:HD domain-containing protein [Lachnospiraceae bacterium]
MKETFDFYSKTALKSYNLEDSMRYQLNMLDNLDVFTRKHSENVANLTCRICEYMHYNKEFTVYATICAYLHDIGKLFIPPSILQKNGPLTDEEYEKMKEHTIIGYDMCMKDLKLRPYAVGARSHHEALNGTGYPDKLAKKKIPLVAQIIRVADEYDAIVSKRQYKSHIDISDTLKIIILNTKPIFQNQAPIGSENPNAKTT